MPNVWTMAVPVLSLAHLPASEYAEITHPPHPRIAVEQHGFFLHIGTDPSELEEYVDDYPYLTIVAEWVQQNFGPATQWVRFNSCGSIVPELARFD